MEGRTLGPSRELATEMPLPKVWFSMPAPEKK